MVRWILQDGELAWACCLSSGFAVFDDSDLEPVSSCSLMLYFGNIARAFQASFVHSCKFPFFVGSLSFWNVLILTTLGSMPNERDMLNAVAVVFTLLCFLGVVNLEPPLRC